MSRTTLTRFLARVQRLARACHAAWPALTWTFYPSALGPLAMAETDWPVWSPACWRILGGWWGGVR